MNKGKKFIAVAVSLSLVTGGLWTGVRHVKENNQKEVLVASVDSLASDYYSPETTLEANITTSASQNITLDNDMIVEEIFVQKGDRVSVGDKLISFDMTLVEMELNIAKLKHQKLEQDFRIAQKRLSSLEKGGPVIESDAYDMGGDGGDTDSWDSDDLEGEGDDMAFADFYPSGNFLAAAPVFPILLTALADMAGIEEREDMEPEEQESLDPDLEETAGGSGEIPGDAYQDSIVSGFSSGQDTNEDSGGISSGEEKPDINAAPEPTPTPVLDEPVDFVDQVVQPANPNFTDGNETFYQTLDENSEPFEGSGTEDDPYIFLCSSAKGWVTVTGGFFNKMAGYNGDGTQVEHEGGFWYLLEFHNQDTIWDYQNRKDSCIGYYLVDGSLLKKPVDRFCETELTLEDALTYEKELPPDDNNGNGGGHSPLLSRKEAIKLQKKRIASLRLDIQESELELSKLEKKLARQTISSKLDGVVAYVGDPFTGTSPGEYFMSVKSADGFYVQGTISELMLDQVSEGTRIHCTNYSSMDMSDANFDAEIIEISEYPVGSENSYFYYGDGNPNVSSYSYLAVIPDKSVQVQDGDWIQVTLEEEMQQKGIVLPKAFVRSENGVNYVYKDHNGALKKQVVSVGGNVNGGYSVLVKGGITRKDRIAFPYGKAVVEGAKTKEGTISQMYGEEEYYG